MPLLKIQTNTNISTAQKDALLERGAQLVVDELNKPLDYVQVIVEGSQHIAFAGSIDKAAFVELRSLGLPEGTPAALSAAIAKLLEDVLDISPKRLFVNFFDLEHANWGWNGGTFG
jgi:phenylpyruvate tautomerase